MKTDRELLHVLFAGTLGGALSWAFGVYLGLATRVSWFVAIPLSAALGAGAAVVFVFLIANTDRTDRPRLLALALLAGFFWQPVWEGGRAIIERQTDERRVEKARTLLQSAAETARRLTFASPEERPQLAEQLNHQLSEAAALAVQVRDVDGLARLRASVDGITAELASSGGGGLPSIANLAGRFEAMETSDVLRELSEGSRIAAFVVRDPGQFLAATAAGSLVEELVPSKLERTEVPSLDAVPRLGLGEEQRVSPEAGATIGWIMFTLDTPLEVAVAVVTSGKNDLVAGVYEVDSLNRQALDDDSGRDRDPLVRARLRASSYLVRVSDYRGRDLEPFMVSLRHGQE